MKNFTIEYTYYGHSIKQTVNIVEMIETMPDELKVETILDVFSVLKGTEKLNDLQKVLLKDKLTELIHLLD